MKVEIIETSTPRIYKLTLDFIGYEADKYWTYHPRKYSYGYRDREVSTAELDKILTDLKLRRLIRWSVDWQSKVSRRDRRYTRYYVTVISDRMNKRNDVG